MRKESVVEGRQAGRTLEDVRKGIKFSFGAPWNFPVHVQPMNFVNCYHIIIYQAYFLLKGDNFMLK